MAADPEAKAPGRLVWVLAAFTLRELLAVSWPCGIDRHGDGSRLLALPTDSDGVQLAG